MEENKKKVIITLVMGIMLLFTLVISATYAYFQIMTSGSSSTLITGSTPQGSNVSVKELLGELHLNLSASDMAYANQGDYYADDEDNYVKSIEDGTHDIAEVQLVGDTQTYYCTGTVNVTMDINEENSMGAVIQKEDLFLHLEGAGLDETLDMFTIKTTGTTSYDLDFEITGGTKETIKAYAKLANKSTDQKYLANKELSINITVSDVNCEIKMTAGDVIRKIKPVGLSETLLGGMYRFQGTVEKDSDGVITKDETENFICFGTDNPKEDCNSRDSIYMYRIIGITPEGELKLLNLKSGMSEWASYRGTNYKWGNNTIFYYINGKNNSGNGFINSAMFEYLAEDSKWYDLIADHEWIYGDVLNESPYLYQQTPDTIYKVETGQSPSIRYKDTRTKENYTWNENGDETVTAKVGLMYIHDFLYAMPGDLICINGYGNTDCAKSWIHQQRWNGADCDWFLTRKGLGTDGDYSAYCINGSGGLSSNILDQYKYYRPVIYIKSNVSITGTGKLDDPFVIESPKSSVEMLKSQVLPDSGLNDKIEGGMYRFQGTNEQVKNYICFGTDDVENDCKNNVTSENMYRIIGITPDGRMKLIKNTAIKENEVNEFRWHYGASGSLTWANSDIFKRLNGTQNGTVPGNGTSSNTNLFINSENYSYMNPSEDNKWYNIIEDHYWKYGTFTSYDNSIDKVYEAENSFGSTVAAKVGMMYLYDYYYSSIPGGRNCGDSKERILCADSWLYLKNNGDSTTSGTSEWTMSAYQKTYPYSIVGYGNLGAEGTFAVRPVFYLKNGVTLSGSGTIADPFVINFD